MAYLLAMVWNIGNYSPTAAITRESWFFAVDSGVINCIPAGNGRHYSTKCRNSNIVYVYGKIFPSCYKVCRELTALQLIFS